MRYDEYMTKYSNYMAEAEREYDLGNYDECEYWENLAETVKNDFDETNYNYGEKDEWEWLTEDELSDY